MFEYKENNLSKELKNNITDLTFERLKILLKYSDKRNETIDGIVNDIREEMKVDNSVSRERECNIAKWEGIATGVWLGGAAFLGGYVIGQLIRKGISKN